MTANLKNCFYSINFNIKHLHYGYCAGSIFFAGAVMQTLPYLVIFVDGFNVFSLI